MKYILLPGFVLFVLTAAGQQKRQKPYRKGNDPERVAALQALSTADTMTQSAWWPQVRPADYLQNLRRNLEKPQQLNTGRSTNFCAFGAVSYTCLKNEPLRYVQTMLELYRNGRARYRNIELAPPETIRLYAGKMMFQGDLDISPADQAWYLSLAHRFKGYLNFFNRRYDPGDENTMWAATNLAKFNRMLRKLCKYKVYSRGSDLVRPHSRNLPAFLQEKLRGGEVYLYLNNSVLRKKNHNRLQKWIPTHYVVLMDLLEGPDGDWVLRYWDGGYQTLREVELRELRQIIYGITWVRYKEENNE